MVDFNPRRHDYKDLTLAEPAAFSPLSIRFMKILAAARLPVELFPTGTIDRHCAITEGR
jgi:hypothetical protein